MALNYKLRANTDLVTRLTDGMIIGVDFPTKADWDEYQDWLAAGNTPEPADPPYTPDLVVEMWQLRCVVARDDLEGKVITAIETQGMTDDSNPYFALWNGGVSTNRQGQFAYLMGSKIGLTSEQLDDIFQRASMLKELPPVM